HAIAHASVVDRVTRPGALRIGESARLTHHGTGEGISQAMQSGIFGAEAVARVVRGEATETASWRRYLWTLRRRFTVGFVAGHVLRDVVDSKMLDRLARTYNSASFRRSIRWLMGAALTGSTSQEAPAVDALPSTKPSGRESRLA